MLAVTAVAFAGCSSGDGAKATSTVSGSITVPAAASLTEAFDQIGSAFEKANPRVGEVRFDFDSSSSLASRIVAGAPADVFASADEANMKKVDDAGLISGAPPVFARNALTIVVKRGNPRQVRGLADLATVGTVSLCGSEVPCGKYADQILERAGVRVPEDRVTRGQNAKATLGAVAHGDADAGIVYATDVTGPGVEAVKIPDAQNAVARYPIAVIKTSGNAATAEAFVAYVLGPEGQATLRAAGFFPPG